MGADNELNRSETSTQDGEAASEERSEIGHERSSGELREGQQTGCSGFGFVLTNTVASAVTVTAAYAIYGSRSWGSDAFEGWGRVCYSMVLLPSLVAGALVGMLVMVFVQDGGRPPKISDARYAWLPGVVVGLVEWAMIRLYAGLQ